MEMHQASGRFVLHTFICAVLCTLPLLVHAHGATIKPNHSAINLWSGAGRSGHEKIGVVRRFEEAEVLKSRTLQNGVMWHEIRIMRTVNGQRQTSTGWVDSRYFTKLENPVEADQPRRSATEARAGCVNCALRSDEPPTRRNNSDDLMAIANATRRGSFIWPVSGVVRSGFGYRRHPIKGVVKLHRGTDISRNNGATVRASKGGVVEVSAGGCRNGRSSCNGGAGNMVTINHGDGTKTRYLHLNPSCRLPRQGTRIAQGVSLGCVGATGAVTGPHLHFEVLKNGKWINPLTVLPKRN